MDFSKLFQNPFILEHPADVSDLQWLIIRGIGFVLVALVITRWIWPSMIAPVLSERRVQIANAGEQVRETLAETEHMRNDYRIRLEGIEDETEARMTEAVREAEDLREHILGEAKQTAAAIVRRGEDEVSRERAKAVMQMRTKFIEDVILAAQYAASRSLDTPEQRRLVEEFTKNVRAKA
jgi:F-type H+-transporting ATPase subunit b